MKDEFLANFFEVRSSCHRQLRVKLRSSMGKKRDQCYGGDISHKRKLSKKEKAKRKRMKKSRTH